MLFSCYKNDDNLWDIRPCSGALEGEVVAVAEGVNMKNVTPVGQTLVGQMKATWGTTLSEVVYHDVETLRGLNLNGKFDMSPQQKAWFDFDGLHVNMQHAVRSVKLLVAMGQSIWLKGQA